MSLRRIRPRLLLAFVSSLLALAAAATSSRALGFTSAITEDVGGTSPGVVGAVTLHATGSRLDFESGPVDTLAFGSFIPGLDVLTIDNSTAAAGMAGTSTTDRFIFNSDQSANLGGIQFAGYLPGEVESSLGGGYYEITPAEPVPEPATWLSAGAAAILILFHHRTQIIAALRRRSAIRRAKAARMKRRRALLALRRA